jgi:hypothetical protein
MLVIIFLKFRLKLEKAQLVAAGCSAVLIFSMAVAIIGEEMFYIIFFRNQIYSKNSIEGFMNYSIEVVNMANFICSSCIARQGDQMSL